MLRDLFLRHIPFMVIGCCLLACGDRKEQSNAPGKQLAISGHLKTILEDTTSVNPLVDSLKREFREKPAAGQLNLLGELAEAWRLNSFVLATEEFRQSKALNDKNGEGDALCKLGIYYCRKFNLDSANYFLDLAQKLAEANQLDNILAQSLSWQAEVLRQSGENDKALDIQSQALVIASRTGDKKRMAFCLLSEGETYRIKSEFGSALDCYSKAIGFAKAVNDLNKIAVSYNGIGEVYRLQNNYPKALDNFNKGLEIAKKNKNKNQIAFCLSCIGDIYSAQNESMKALNFYEEAYHIAVELGLKLQECNSLSSMGMAYFLLSKYDKALDCFGKALGIAEQIGNKDRMAFILSTTGEIYRAQKDYDKALESFRKTVDISSETGNKNQLANTYKNIGECYFSTGKYDAAVSATEKSLSMAEETGTLESIKNAAKLLSDIYLERHEPAKSLRMLDLFIRMKDSIGNEEQVKRFAAVEYQAKEDGLKAEQKAKEDTFKAEQARKEEELKRQKTIRYAFTIGFALVLILVIVVYRGLQQNKKQNRIISAQKKEMEHQKELVEEKNKEIIDSITYAKRLQDAILPPVKMVKQWFPESFVLYKPKDIIAGDFYWMEHIGDLTFFAAADSTGHGVPGAMVSVVCSNALNRAIKEFRLNETGKILDKTRELVLETFAKSEGEVKDGMDISLISINNRTGAVSWSGANNPLWYVHNGEVAEIKANKQPIGKTDNPKPFETHLIDHKPGSIYYLFTDGFADQFGGPKGKKFKYKQLEEVLLANADKPLEEQKELLETIFNDWKGKFDQVDDVTLIGIRL